MTLAVSMSWQTQIKVWWSNHVVRIGPGAPLWKVSLTYRLRMHYQECGFHLQIF